MATIHITLDTDNELDLNLLRGLAGGTYAEYEVDDDELAEIHQEAQGNDGLLEQDRALEDGDADEPPVSEQAAGRAVSPYGFADPNREPGKPGEGRKRRTKAEMAEDEAYEAQVSGGDAPQEEQAPQPGQPEEEPEQLEEEPEAPQAPQAPQAPPVQQAPTSSPFNF